MFIQSITHSTENLSLHNIFKGFEILAGNPSGNFLVNENLPRIVFHLKDLKQKKIIYVKKDSKVHPGKKRLVKKVILKSFEKIEQQRLLSILGSVGAILANLHHNQCVGKPLVAIQWRVGQHNKNNLRISPLIPIILEELSGSVTTSFSEGIISHSYAYLTERKVCLFLNEYTDELVKRLETILANHLPKKNEWV
ncbi:hypothetical protein BN1013_01809 [Candidatus Rubidus massiliensis]|nr:hypothetical protein BN1013_01809 [Candidatus Rubidus massiliensis]